MTFLLCVDTSLRGVSAALVNKEDVSAAHPAWLGAHLDVMSSASQITELVGQGLRDARTTASEVTGVAVSCGPGSFTGIKIGLSFAAGFTFGRRETCGLLGLSSLESALSTKMQRSDGETDRLQLFLAATKTHGFVCRSDADGRFRSSLVDLSINAEEVVDSLLQGAGWSGVIGTWPMLEQQATWLGGNGETVAVEEVTDWALQGMIQSAVRQWPAGFGVEMPEPQYMRLSTAEEKKQV